MRRFLASAWFPIVACALLAGVTAGAFAMLKPTGADVGNQQVVDAFKIAGWAAGPAIGLVSLILMFILNGIRRILKVRRVNLLHPVVVLVGILPWLCLAWAITGEPRFTPFARAAIDFVARPMLWGALASSLFAILGFVPTFFPKKK